VEKTQKSFLELDQKKPHWSYHDTTKDTCGLVSSGVAVCYIIIVTLAAVERDAPI